MADVTLERRGAVAIITLDDGKANALRPSLLTELEQALDAAQESDARAVVLAGRAGFYSAGLDLKLLPTLSHPEKIATFHHFSRLMIRVAGYGLPTVAAIGGHAIAGGAILALACDVRIGGDGPQKIGLTEVPLGLPLPTFAIEIARSAVPTHLLAEAVLHGRQYTMGEAHAAGLVEAVVAPEALLDAAVARAAGLAKIPEIAYAFTKDRLLGDGLRASLHRLDGEVNGFIRIFEERFAAR